MTCCGWRGCANAWPKSAWGKAARGCSPSSSSKWQASTATTKTPADREVMKAQAQIAERCRELGIPDRFAPGLHLSWYDRGENAVGKRRTELRFVARSRIAEIEKTARSTIERTSLEVQTEILRTALGSDAAVTFLERMPSVEQLMPPFANAAIEQMLEPRQAGKQRISLLT